MAKLKEILIKIKNILLIVEDQFLFFIPEKYREKVRNIINTLIVIIGAILAAIAIF